MAARTPGRPAAARDLPSLHAWRKDGLATLAKLLPLDRWKAFLVTRSTLLRWRGPAAFDASGITVS
jgi:hypothetical protein